MNLKRALGYSALLWIFIFVEVSVLMFGLQMPNPDSSLVHFILLGIITLAVSYLYFSTKTVKASVQQGILFGLAAIIFSAIIDAIITVPLFMQWDYAALFLNGWLWVGYIEIIVITTFVGAFKKR